MTKTTANNALEALNACHDVILQLEEDGDSVQLCQFLEAMKHTTKLAEDRQQTRADQAQQKPRPGDQALISTLFDQEDIWVNNILPFLGMGQYAFVGAINKRMNATYKEYCGTVKSPPKVKIPDQSTTSLRNQATNPIACVRIQVTRPATSTDSFYGAAFCNIPCMEYWLADQSPNKGPARDDVCAVIARLEVFQCLNRPTHMGFHGVNLPALLPTSWTLGSFEVGCRKGLCLEHSHMCCCSSRRELDVLKWLHENGCNWDYTTAHKAALGGHLDLLKWARARGCPWDNMTCAYAALGNHLEVLKWVRATTDGRLGNHICAGAAAAGNLEVLKWARANGCAFTITVCTFAAGVGNLEMLTWAREHGAPGMK
ncbi:expressed unknown protein [Seminavis robusta]|uniref:Ankyrin repeat-containing domain n=1 Tax=Seminavis robusta TaxID=568900 RepID=A0A9N8EAH3_9STRA|nr:expressed unknown protein [Seminavis robusta]|eukprot:Sro883_g215441.1  (371) ;mRNA; r:9411-10523